MTRIKICGITREQDAIFAADRGADFLGFVFVHTSPRYLEPERAAEIAAAVQQGRGSPPKLVGVFHESSADYIREVAKVARLDLVQLQGAETDEDINDLGLPAIKTCRVGDALPDTTAYPSAAWLLFDTYDERRTGSTVRRFDWSLLAMYSRSKPFFLSGGLTPDNVGAAISLVRPDAIDISSGLEHEAGVKDPGKVERLFERVRRG